MKCKAKEKHWALKCFCGQFLLLVSLDQLVMCRLEFKPLKLKISSQESESASLWPPSRFSGVKQQQICLQEERGDDDKPLKSLNGEL